MRNPTDHAAEDVRDDQIVYDPRCQVQAFVAADGRAPCVLHIGNIANNAYLNAQILNDAGFNCDVICYDYYHIMGCPEWEDADFDDEIENHFNPDWTSVDLHGFQRPRWFAQGPLEACITYLQAYHAGHDEPSQEWWNVMEKATSVAGNPLSILRRVKRKVTTLCTKLTTKGKACLKACFEHFAEIMRSPRHALTLPTMVIRQIRRLLHAILSRISNVVIRVVCFAKFPQIYVRTRRLFKPSVDNTQQTSSGFSIVMCVVLFVPLIIMVSARRIWNWSQRLISLVMWQTPIEADPVKQRFKKLQATFIESFPDREDQLSASDVIAYASVLPKWRELFKHYDAVIGYATDGLLPLLCDKRPYLAFEHGTIRNIPFEPTAQGRLCAVTYRLANTSLITNCDNIKAAGELQLDNYCFVPHPVNERHINSECTGELRESLKRELDCDFIVFHPSRQHWEPRRHPDWEKGNDILIRGFADFIRNTASHAGAIFVDWGQKVDESRKLLEELGIGHHVKWIAPLPNRRMINYIRASDVVADQFFLGAFGSLTPKALLHECPVMLHLDEERHRWCFPEMPPVINVNTPEGVCEGLTRLYNDEGYRQDLIHNGSAWYHRYHSNDVISTTLTRAIMQGIEQQSVK